MGSAIFSTETAHVRTLPNGLTVTLERLPHVHSFSAGIWVKAGSAVEHDKEAGIAHFLEHLVFKGTATRTPHDLMQEIEGRGGQFNAFTSREYTCIYVKMLAEHVRIGVEVLADIIKNATLNDLEKERNVILEEIASVEDTPDEYVHDLITEQHWPDHPLGRPVSGTCESVTGIGIDDVRRFQKAWYRPANMVLSVAGNIDEEAVAALIEAELGGLNGGPAATRATAPTFCAGRRHVERDIAQSHICLAYPGVTVDAAERYTSELLSSVLGGGSTSRLFERIREDEGLAYAICSYQSTYLAAGVFGVYAAVAPHNLRQTLEITAEELRRLREEPVPEEELRVHREQLKGGVLMALENTFTRMARMAKSMLYYGRILPLHELIHQLDAVTAEGVQHMAQRMFTHDNTALLVLGRAEAGQLDRDFQL